MDALRGKQFRLFQDARDFHEEYYRRQYFASYETSLEEAAVARADILVLRISMLLALGDGSVMISRDHISAAWRIVEYSCGVVTGFIDRLRDRNLREVENRITAACLRVAREGDGSFTKRQINQKLKGSSGLDSETFNRVWSALKDVGAICPSGGGPGERYRINT